MKADDLLKILSTTINDIKNDKIGLSKAQAVVKTSNSIIKLHATQIAYNRLTNNNKNKISFFEK